jgi:hypothetical protein
VARAIDVFARAGVVHARIHYQARLDPFFRAPGGGVTLGLPGRDEHTTRQWRPVLGLGGEWAPMPHWAFRIEAARYFNLGDEYGVPGVYGNRGKIGHLDTVMLGAAYTF